MAGQTIQISVLADTKKFSSAMKNLGQKSGLSKLGSIAKTAAKGLAVAGAAVVGLGAVLFKAGETAGTSNARIAQIFETVGVLGDGASKASERVQDLSNSMARSTGINQNMIKEGAAILGTFSNIASSADEAGGAFDRSLAAAADLSAAGFGSVTSASTMLGKALQDPATGLTALTRVGVIFSEETKNQIKAMQESGDAAGAQALLLEAVEGQVGGVAAATADASDQIKVAFSQITERLGLALMPAFTKLTDFILDKVVPAVEDTLAPAIERLSAWLTETLVPALSRAADWFGENVVPVVQELAAELKDRLVPAVQDFASWVTGTAIPALKDFGGWLKDNKDTLLIVASAVTGFVVALKTLNYIKNVTAAVKLAAGAFKVLTASMLANPIGLIVAGIAALVAGLVYFFTKTETGKKIWDKVWGGIKAVAQAVSDWFTGTLLPILQTVWDGIVAAAEVALGWYQENVAPIFEAVGELVGAVWERITEGANLLWEQLQTAWDAITLAWSILWENIMAVWEVIGPPIMAAIQGAFEHMKIIITTIWNVIKAVIETVLGVIRGIIAAITSAIRGDWSGVWNAIKGIASTVWNGIKRVVSSVFNGIKRAISNTLNTIKSVWSSAWNSVKTVLSNAWRSMKSTVTTSVLNVITTVRSLPRRARQALGNIGSALLNAGRQLIQGLLDGITAGFGRVRDKLSELTNLLPSWKGPAKRDKTLLKNAGQLIIGGLVDGLESQYGKVKSTLGTLTGMVAGTDMGTIGGPRLAYAGSATPGFRGRTSGHYGVAPVINVYALAGGPEVGRQVHKALRDYERTNGVRS